MSLIDNKINSICQIYIRECFISNGFLATPGFIMSTSHGFKLNNSLAKISFKFPGILIECQMRKVYMTSSTPGLFQETGNLEADWAIFQLSTEEIKQVKSLAPLLNVHDFVEQSSGLLVHVF